jgi:hypothetical protein
MLIGAKPVRIHVSGGALILQVVAGILNPAILR